MDDLSRFGAGNAALGYAFQWRYALLRGLQLLRQDLDFLVSIETLDDIAITSASGVPIELLQLKHHVTRRATLADAGRDLWKTLRIWGERIRAGELPSQTQLFLVTTATASPGTAAYMLRRTLRSVDSALARLRSIAATSQNATNLAGYEAFRALTPEQQKALLEMIIVMDGTVDVTGADEELRREVALVVDRQLRAAFLDRLEGWWFRQVVQSLTATPAQLSVSNQDLEAAIGRFREQFSRDSLPIDDEIAHATVDRARYDDRVFVHQLTLIGLGAPRIMFAVNDYFRAYEQRSRWVREELLIADELERYESRLIEEWQRRFERMRDDLGDQAAEVDKTRLARALYAWVETEADYRIRPRCEAPFLVRGSYHMLADTQRVGWHAEYLERLKVIIETLAK